MATKEEIYVSVSPQDYRKNKSSILTCQAESLMTLKRLHNLKVLARQKHDLKKRLHKLLVLVSTNIEGIQEKLPTTKMPKSVNVKEEFIKTKKKSLPKDSGIEDELKQIQEKLRQLNS